MSSRTIITPLLRAAFIGTTLLVAGCASKPVAPPQPTASEQLAKMVEVIDLIEQSRPADTDRSNATSEKMKAMLTELGSEIDNIEDPASRNEAINSLLEFVDRQSDTDTNLLSGIFQILMK